MKNIIAALIISTVLLGCQKDFPEPTDFAQNLNADLIANWQVDLPEGEKVVFVFTQESQAIYITKDAQNMHSYVLESTGVVTQKHSYNVTDLKYIEPYRDHKLLSNWIQIKSHTHNIFLNPVSGEMNELFESNDNKPGSKVEYHLGKDNVCYHLEYTAQNDVICKIWDLENDEVSTLDTLERRMPSNELSSFLFLGENENLHYRNNYSQHLIYLKMKYERGQDVYACSMAGISFNHIFGSVVWSSDILFRNINADHEMQNFIWDKTRGIFFTADKTLYCLDFLQHTVKWKRVLPSRIGGNIIPSDSRLYFTVQDEKTYCLDANSGSTIWSSGFGYAQNKIALEDGILAISGLRSIESDQLLADAFNTLHLIDAITGRELYRNYDQLQKGYNIPNDFRYGLTRAVVLKNKRLYLADENQFLSFSIQKE